MPYKDALIYHENIYQHIYQHISMHINIYINIYHVGLVIIFALVAVRMPLLSLSSILLNCMLLELVLVWLHCHGILVI